MLKTSPDRFDHRPGAPARLGFGAYMKLSALVRGLNRRHASRAAGFVAATIGTAAFIAWWSGLATLSPSWGSGLVTTKPATALCIAALGVALVHPGKDSRLAFTVGLAVALIAMLDLLDQFAIDLGINHVNRWLVPRAAVAAETSFRMINGVPVALALAAASLALSRFERYHFAATAFGVLAGVMQVFVLLTRVSGVNSFYGSIGTPTPLTAVGLLCVAIAIVLRIAAMPALRKPRPLSHLLITLGCAIIAPLLLFGLYTGIRITDAQLRQVRNELMSEARILSAGVDREIIGEIERLQALAASPSLRQGDFAEFQRQAEASLALQQRGNIVLIDRNLQQLVNTFVPFGKPLPKAVVPKLVERTFATDKPQVTGLFMAPIVNQFLYGITVPVEIGGESRYVLGRSQDQHTLARLVAANELPPGRLAVVADAAHRVIARSEQGDAFIGKELPPAQWHRAGPGGVFEFTDPEKQSWLQAYARSDLTGWEIAVWAPKTLVEAPAQALWWTIALTASLAFMLAVALASWLGGIITSSVSHAARAAIAAAESDSPSADATPIVEVNTLTAELRERTDSLRESEATFRAMFDFSSVAKVESEYETGRLLRANAAMCKFLGYGEAELLARTVFDITHPDERERDRVLLRRMVGGQLAVFDMEKRYVRKDGKVAWAHTTANIIRDKSGQPLRYTVVVEDINARKQAEQDLLASKDRLQLAFNVAQLGSYQYDPGRRVFSGDARAHEIFDFPNNEATLEEIMNLVHPHDVETVQANLQAALDPVNPRRSATEFRLRRGNGKIRWAETLGLAYFEGAGPQRRAVSFIGTLQDITERKEREEKEHLLMREINHRAKNMLSVVDAIAHQTAVRSPEKFVERFSERIQALSANQDLLVRNEWKGVDIADLVYAQLAHFAGLIGSRIVVQGPKLRLNAACAQAIGLALHELATNAGKYGALSTDSGHVDVSWGTDGNTLTMSWTERAGPPVSAPPRRGFGTIVMEAMAERSVDGKVDLDYAPSGLTWRLSCPTGPVLEPTPSADASS
jgi:PAS domain S-box-containing protein